MKCARCGKKVKAVKDLICIDCWQKTACINLDLFLKEKNKKTKILSLSKQYVENLIKILDGSEN